MLSAEGEVLLGYAERLLRLAAEAQGALSSGALVERVRSGDLEAAFVAEPFNAEGLETLHVFDEELVLIGAKGLPAKSPLRPVLAFAAGCSYRRRLEAWLARAGISPARVMEYGSYHAIVACAAAGSGIAVVPRSILDSMRLDVQLSVRRLPARVAKAKTRLVWREGHGSSALDALQAILQGLPRASQAKAART